MTEKSRWQKEFAALPEWAQKMVRAAGGIASYGGGSSDALVGMSKESRDKYTVFHAALRKEAYEEWFDGFCDLRELAAALTAPWPPPTDLKPHEQMTTGNIVEMMTAGEDDCAFDQPCYFGHRVECHAVYCHNDAWPDSPRKCRRRADDPEYRHEDCPGFAPHPDGVGQTESMS
jgi:hypothetical protein